MAITLQASFLTSPVGFVPICLKGVYPPEVRRADLYQGGLPFILLQLLALALVLGFPGQLTWLLAQAYG